VGDRGIAGDPAVVAAVAAAEARLGLAGRILVRPSGTEPLVRVMVEAADEATTSEVAETVAGVIRTAAGSIAET
jgi:phosphoglucosamine mutase